MSRRALALHGLLLICTLAVFANNVHRYYFLGDDAFISFRYANHLVQGRGLTWNHDERVEGYTNFLWVMMMAAVLAAGGQPEVVSNVVGIASGAALLAALSAFSARAFGRDSPFVWLAPLTLASSRTFTAWCTGGLETLFFALLVFLGLWAFLVERERRVRIPVGSALLFSLVILTRPDGVLFGAVAAAFFGAAIVLGRRPFRAGVAWALPLVLIVGGHLLWRHGYYGYWLPNTFYAKVPGAWWEQGFRYLSLFAADYRIGWFLPLAALAPALRRDAASRLFGAVTLVWLSYVAAVGGDRFEFRFLVPILPYVYWLVTAALVELVQRAATSGWRPLRRALLAGIVALALLFATTLGPRRPEATRIRHGVNTLASIAFYANYRAREGRMLRRLSDEGVLPPDVVLCVGGAGAVPYYTDWTTIDRRGLNDVTIAHQPLPERGVIAHEREPSYAYLRERGVVIFDAFNRLLQPDDEAVRERRSIPLDGRELRTVAIPVGGAFLTFATPLDDEELKEIFAGLDVPD